MKKNRLSTIAVTIINVIIMRQIDKNVNNNATELNQHHFVLLHQMFSFFSCYEIHIFGSTSNTYFVSAS